MPKPAPRPPRWLRRLGKWRRQRRLRLLRIAAAVGVIAMVWTIDAFVGGGIDRPSPRSWTSYSAMFAPFWVLTPLLFGAPWRWPRPPANIRKIEAERWLTTLTAVWTLPLVIVCGVMIVYRTNWQFQPPPAGMSPNGVAQWRADQTLAAWWNDVKWFAAFLAAYCAWVAYVFWRRHILAQKIRLAEGRCDKCGYSLRGLPEPRCPECGAAFAPAGGGGQTAKAAKP